MEDSPELRWLPIEPTSQELELMQQWEDCHRQLLTAFALTPEEIGLTQDVNKAYAEQQEAIYRRRFG